MASIADYKINRLTKNTTLTVKIKTTRQLKVRVVLAMFLLRMAARTLGCGIEITTDEKPRTA